VNKPIRLALRAAILVVAALFVRQAEAQEPWRASYFPYLVGGPTDGLMGIARYQWTKGAPYFVTKKNGDEIVNPLSFAGAVSLEGGYGTRGTRYFSGVFRGPALVDGWRFHGELTARRDGRFGYYPGGGETVGDPEGQANRVRRSRYLARFELTRRIVGPLMVSAAGSVERTEFSPLSDLSLLTAAIKGTDAISRVSVIVDTRDAEFVPANGILAEAGAYTGTDGIDPDLQGGSARASYRGGYVHLRGYVSPRPGTVFAGRFGYRGLSAGAPLSATYQMPGWEKDITVLGGVESHRGLVKGRMNGRGVIMGGLEVRHDLLNAGDFGAITLLGFVDGGRVFYDEGPRLTTEGWEMGYGGGAALRILRSAVLTFNFAGGADGFTFGTGTGWSF